MTAQLGKVMPIALLVGMVVYCCRPYLAGTEAGAPADGMRKLPEVTSAMLHPAPGAVAERDPFRLPPPARAAMAAHKPAGPAAQVAKAVDPAADTAKLLSGLALHATYIHGQRRVALINGLVYAEGEPLKPANPTTTPFVVAWVYPDRVLLRRLGQTVELHYADKSPAAGTVPQARRDGAGSGKAREHNGGR